MKILIGADLVPTKTNIDMFSNGNLEQLLGKDLISELNNSDMRIFNLETPLIDKKNPIKKVGPILGIETCTVKGIKKMNPDFLTLANNHIMDHNISGLNTTIKTLKDNNIEYGGIGSNVKDCNKMWIKKIMNIRIGIYACAEHEFSIATEERPGANPFDFIDSYRCIEENRKKCDFIIVLYHGGKEYYPYPSPRLQKVCRYFIDKGADFVVCQHSHCIGCEEVYKNKKIVYGQGNFLFDKTKRIEWNHGLLLVLNVSNDFNYDLDYIVLTKTDNRIRKATKEEFDEVMSNYEKRNKEILNPNFVKENYIKFANDNIGKVLTKMDLLSNTLFGKVLTVLTNNKVLSIYLKKIYLKKLSYRLSNVIECEAWNEMLQTIVDDYNK